MSVNVAGRASEAAGGRGNVADPSGLRVAHRPADGTVLATLTSGSNNLIIIKIQVSFQSIQARTVTRLYRSPAVSGCAVAAFL